MTANLLPDDSNCTTNEFWYNKTMVAIQYPQRVLTVLFLCLFWLPTQAVYAENASETITHLQGMILKIMKEGDTLGFKGRYEVITPVIDQTHDLHVIARISVGKHWKTFTTEQQEEFINTFKKLSHSTYADRFNSYAGEKFNVISEKALKRNRKLVQTRFVKSDGEEFRFNYVLHQVKAQWKIINIMVNGVSDLALKRTEYGGILQKGGYSILLEKLRSQIQESANGL
jgi:phospholipid transport system substrate-binding protein